MSDHAELPTPTEPAPPSSPLTFPVVGIGASAGGVTALGTLFDLMPPDSGMAFVVLLHLPPRQGSHLAELLQKRTRMPVVALAERQRLKPDQVVVVPAGKLPRMDGAEIWAEDLEPPRQRAASLDLFFRALATAHRERAMAVVLSGAGSDGAVGLTRIKEEGGISIAQNPHEAEYDGMPRAAIATGAVDWILPLAEVPAKLVDTWTNMRSIHLPEPESIGPLVQAPAGPQELRDAEQALQDVLLLLRARTGHDFRNYKRATVLRRLERRLQVNGLPTLPAYRAYLQSHGEEAQALLKDLLIGVTNFFRDREAFDVLQRTVVPELFVQAARSPGGLRVWTAGCASGEEAYSLAMLLLEHNSHASPPPKIQVFASDIDDEAITQSRAGCYPSAIEADVSPSRLRRFFTKEGHQYRVRKEVRERVMFAAQNILRDPPFSRLDLISCRNLLIYLDREVHPQIMEMFHFALKPGGYLFLGSSESADTVPQLFSVVDKKNRIFRANIGPRPARLLPSLPVAMARGTSLPPVGELVRERVGPSYGDLLQRLTQHLVPPAVLTNAEGQVLHLSEQAGQLLRPPAGAPSLQLLNMVPPELRLELRSAMYQALQSGHGAESRAVHVTHDSGAHRRLAVKVRPVRESAVEAPLLLLVTFVEAPEARPPQEVQPVAPGDRDPLIAHLEEELRRLKEQLQDTIESSETSNEELKASNEELQAINEELRSTTEELETSKEELQSINEELITVNHELKAKVEETGKINDDLNNLIASTDIATVFVDRAMSIKRFTPHATTLFNLIPGDVGRSLLDITHRLDYPALSEDAAAAFQSLRTIEREVRSADGRWYLARVLPYRTTEDLINGAVLTFVDISSRRQAEDKVLLVAESMKDYAILTLDVDGLISSWSPGAERVFGHTEREVVGQRVDLIFTPEDRAAGVPAEELRRAQTEGRAEDERWHLRKEGRRIFCSGVTIPLLVDGRLRGWGKIARDLTDNRLAEVEREAQLRQESTGRAEAQSDSRMKDEFLAVMSHELKNPLNLIQLHAELLARLPEARSIPAVAKAAETIRRTVLTQAQIIDDLLDLSRVQTGKLLLQPEPTDLTAIVRRIAEALEEEAQRKTVALTVVLPAEPVVLHADPVRMEQVVWNLASNALKFTPAGGRVLLALALMGEQVQLQVSDSGRGIAPQALPHVFDMFRQADAITGRRQGGLGIGLALVRNLVQAHGGEVQAESPGLDEGSTFTVWLPTQAAPGSLSAQQIDTTATLLRGRRALVVDDDPQSVDALRQLLELEGVNVAVAHGVPEALALAQAQRFDFVLSDIAMPGEDGYSLLRQLHALPGGAALPVLALTGYGRPMDAQRAQQAGFAAHLKKPLSLEHLLDVLGRVL